VSRQDSCLDAGNLASWGRPADGRDAGCNCHLKNVCVFGQEAAAGVENCIVLGAQLKDVVQAALGRAFRPLAFGSYAGLLRGILASGVLAFRVYSHNSSQSAGIRRRCSDYIVAGAAGEMDSSATRCRLILFILLREG